MPIRLPRPFSSFFASTKAHDVLQMIHAFADGTALEDEGQELIGRAAIRKWIRATVRRYDFQAEPIKVTGRDRRVVVTASVSGSFPGSPVNLRYAFELERGKVTRLEFG